MKIKIQIQSISDIITNSSSEIFCTITSGNFINEIHELLKPLFGDYDFYDDMNPGMSSYENYIEISMPYGMSNVEEFYKAGLKAILDTHIGEENYSIEYEY